MILTMYVTGTLEIYKQGTIVCNTENLLKEGTMQSKIFSNFQKTSG